MSKQKSPQKESRIREAVPCLFAFLIFVVPLVVYMVIFPIAGPIISLFAGVGAYLVILAICIIIWWRGRVTK
jgi:hypothetical protein